LEKKTNHLPAWSGFSQVCATGLKIKLLGETSIASTIISYLDNASVFIGSSYKDSQVWCIKGIHFIVEQN
jgi:hypothetical protein